MSSLLITRSCSSIPPLPCGGSQADPQKGISVQGLSPGYDTANHEVGESGIKCR